MSSLEDKGLVPPGSVEGPVGRRSSGAATNHHADIANALVQRFRRARRGHGGYPTGMEIAAVAEVLEQHAELLEALSNCVSLVRLKFGNTDDGANAAQAQAYAAIAKATGQENSADRDELAREGSVSK